MVCTRIAGPLARFTLPEYTEAETTPVRALRSLFVRYAIEFWRAWCHSKWECHGGVHCEGYQMLRPLTNAHKKDGNGPIEDVARILLLSIFGLVQSIFSSSSSQIK